MKKENRQLDFETLRVFVILLVLTGAFLFGMQLVLFAPTPEPWRAPAEIRSQIDPGP